MDVIRIVGNVLFSAASLVVGLRLLVLYRKTRALPELLIGLSFIAGGGIGYTLAWSLRWLELPDSMRLAVFVSIRLLIAAACALVLLFAWRVFRPDSPWAKAAVGINLVLLLTYVFRYQIAGQLDAEGLVRYPLFWPETLAQCFGYAWASWEALRHQTMLKRRGRLGLEVDRLLVRRMSLLGAALGAIGFLFLATSANLVIRLETGLRLPMSQIIAALGLASAALLWTAFFPPRALRPAAVPAEMGFAGAED